MSMLKATELTHIRYEKATSLGSGSKGEVTERYVIPTFVPKPNIKALDVTELDDDQREQMQCLYAEYQQYYQQKLSTIFTFEDWISHTQDAGKDIQSQIKWRTFRTENVDVLSD